MDAAELFDKYLDANFRSFEGERGVRDLERLCERLGYGRGFMTNRALEDFLSDNPGAVEAVVMWIGEWVERSPEWQECLGFEEDEEEEYE